MRIGKHIGCGGEFVATEISMDTITEITCKKCGFSKEERIVPKWKRDLIGDFNQAINGVER